MKIVIIVIFIISICLMIYTIFKKHKELYLGKGLSIDMITSHIHNSIPACNLAKPILNNEFSFNFWIYIDDFYYNNEYNCWKHIFHKGSIDGDKNIVKTYETWNILTNSINEQSIGLWMHPNVNNLRVAINVESEDTNYNIEYCDIKNIPSKELVNITILTYKNYMEIYINGKLYKTKRFTNNIVFNEKSMYFNYGKTYSGKLYNFLYLPKIISYVDIQDISNNKPKLKLN